VFFSNVIYASRDLYDEGNTMIFKKEQDSLNKKVG